MKNNILNKLKAYELPENDELLVKLKSCDDLIELSLEKIELLKQLKIAILAEKKKNDFEKMLIVYDKTNAPKFYFFKDDILSKYHDFVYHLDRWGFNFKTINLKRE
jgi:hypothetical protein